MQIKVDYEKAAARRYPEQVVIALARDTRAVSIRWRSAGR